MLTGKRFVLRKACTGITDFEKRKSVLIPAGAVIEIQGGPVPGGRLLDVSWKGNTFLMFSEDIQEHGEPMPNRDAAFRPASSRGQHD
jgi:hypothetical protein